MDIFNGRYYKSCKWFLVRTGLWPYQSNFKRRMGHLAWYVVNITLALPQILLLTQEWGKNLIVTFENAMSLMFALGCSAKFSTASFRMPQLKLLFFQITKDWKRITDQSERDILRKYNEQGRNLVIFYTLYVFSAWIIYTMLPFLPYILDKTFPLENGTRPLFFSFYADYIFFEQVDYHYWTVWHAALVYLHSAFLFSGVDTIFVLTVKHTCGLFAVIGYRLNVNGKTEQNIKPITQLDDDLKRAITLHNETIRCCGFLEDSFSTCFLLVQSLSIFGLAIACVYILYILHDLFRVLRAITITAGLIMHLLYLHWVGQQIINSSEEILNSTEWHRFSLSSRKLIGIIMTRSLRPCYLTAGKISNLSMESYEMILKSVVSYFTVFLSVM